MGLLLKKAIGIDIADNTIEIVESGRAFFGTPRVLRASRLLLEPGLVERGRIINKEKLVLAFKQLLKNAKPTPIKPCKMILSLPDSQTYISVLTVPKEAGKNLELAILSQIDASFPIDPRDRLHSFKILKTLADAYEVLVVAASKSLAIEWRDFFADLKIEIVFFDLEALALKRGLQKVFIAPYAILDLGSASSNCYIFDKHGLNYVYNAQVTGESLTVAVASTLKIDSAAAEDLKIKKGIAVAGDQASEILLAEVDKLATELNQALTYFENREDLKISGIILAGGTSRLVGLLEYLKIKLNRSIVIGTTRFLRNPVPLEYIEAAGLTLRTLDKKYKNDLNLRLAKDHEIKIANLQNFSEIRGRSLSVSNDTAPAEFIDSFNSTKNPVADLKKQKQALFILLAVAVLVSAYFLYNYWQKNLVTPKIPQSLLTPVNSNSKSLDFNLIIATSPLQYLDGRVPGRIFDGSLKTGVNYTSALNLAIDEARQQLHTGENLFKDPIATSSATSTLNLTATSSASSTRVNSVNVSLMADWLIYTQRDYLDLAKREIDRLASSSKPYSLDSVEIIGASTIPGSELYSVKVRAKIYPAGH